MYAQGKVSRQTKHEKTENNQYRETHRYGRPKQKQTIGLQFLLLTTV